MTKPPNHLSTESKREWRRFGKLFQIDDDASLVLREYFEARERKIAAQAAIATDGLIVTDRFGQRKAHPAASIVRDSQSLMLRCLTRLGLPIEAEPDDPSEPERHHWSGGRKPRPRG